MKRVFVVWVALLVGSLWLNSAAAGQRYSNPDNALPHTGVVKDANANPLRDLADCNTFGLPSNLWLPVQSQTVASALLYRIVEQNNFYRKMIVNLSFKLQIDFVKITLLTISSLRSCKHYYTLGLQKMRC